VSLRVRRSATDALNLDGTADRIDDASELNEDAVTCPLDYPAMMYGDGRVDQVTPECA
jgi:hypothetical protein